MKSKMLPRFRRFWNSLDSFENFPSMPRRRGYWYCTQCNKLLHRRNFVHVRFKSRPEPICKKCRTKNAHQAQRDLVTGTRRD